MTIIAQRVYNGMELYWSKVSVFYWNWISINLKQTVVNSDEYSIKQPPRKYSKNVKKKKSTVLDWHTENYLAVRKEQRNKKYRRHIENKQQKSNVNSTKSLVILDVNSPHIQSKDEDCQDQVEK